jgi:hypothetical protein
VPNSFFLSTKKDITTVKKDTQTESSRDQNGKSDKNENREYAQRQNIKESQLRRSRRQEGIGTRRNMDKKE